MIQPRIDTLKLSQNFNGNPFAILCNNYIRCLTITGIDYFTIILYRDMYSRITQVRVVYSFSEEIEFEHPTTYISIHPDLPTIDPPVF